MASLQPKYWAIIPAAGIGKRMKSDIPKQYLTIAGKSVLELTIERLRQVKELEKIMVVLNPADTYWNNQKNISHANINSNLLTVQGGEERLDSVYNGLCALTGEAERDDWVLIHDAVRPCVAISDINNLMTTLQADLVGGLLMSPVKETLKKSVSGLVIDSTVDRNHYWLAATPQMFRFGIILDAIKAVKDDGKINMTLMTDESAVLEAQGYQVKLVEGRSDNIKITQPADLTMAAHILKSAGNN